MGGKAPKTIITDHYVSMRTSIPSVFPDATHRNCFFHILKKSEEKCGRSFATKFNLHADFIDILRNSLTVQEFELLWQEMIVKYDVGNLKYHKAMWENRNKFVPVYFKSDFSHSYILQLEVRGQTQYTRIMLVQRTVLSVS